MNLNDIKNKISECKSIEAGIGVFIHEDTQNYSNLLREHSKLENYISELYREITLMGKEHELFEHINTESGKKITELLRGLKGKLASQYEDLLKIKDIVHHSNKTTFSNEEITQIKIILDGNKNGQNESETSQTIKQIESSLISLVSNMPQGNVLSDEKFVKVHLFDKDIFVERKYYKIFSGTDYVYFDDSLVSLLSRGCTRHLNPNEYFELLKNQKYTFNLNQEWVNMLIKISDGKLYVAFNPISVKRKNNGAYSIIGSYDIISMPMGELELNKYNYSSSFPKELREFVGPLCTGLILNKSYEDWCPVSAGRPESEYHFDLFANHDDNMSRGVREL